MKKFFHSPARIVECVSEYIFLISKNKNKKQKRVQKKQRKLGSSPGEDFSRHPISGNKNIFWPNLITDQRSVCKYVTYMSHNF